MTSEYYKLGFKDGSEGLPRREISCAFWQAKYNEGYADGQKGIKGWFQTNMQHALYRGGC